MGQHWERQMGLFKLPLSGLIDHCFPNMKLALLINLIPDGLYQGKRGPHCMGLVSLWVENK